MKYWKEVLKYMANDGDIKIYFTDNIDLDLLKLNFQNEGIGYVNLDNSKNISSRIELVSLIFNDIPLISLSIYQNYIIIPIRDRLRLRLYPIYGDETKEELSDIKISRDFHNSLDKAMEIIIRSVKLKKIIKDIEFMKEEDVDGDIVKDWEKYYVEKYKMESIFE
jgi:hypothetical protein